MYLSHEKFGKDVQFIMELYWNFIGASLESILSKLFVSSNNVQGISHKVGPPTVGEIQAF